jgi:DNA polymerase-3 subunit epsilon
MGKCIRCGTCGPLVTVDGNGLCALCRSKPQKAEKKTVTSSDLNPESVFERYRTTDHSKYPSEYRVTDYYTAEFDCMLNAIPSVAIRREFCDAPPQKPKCVYLRTLDGSRPEDLRRFVALDTETSALGSSAEIVEISAIRFVDFRPTEVFSTLCRPYRAISPQATEVHGITDGQVKDAPRFAELIPHLSEFLGKDPLVAHNAPFDLGMLASEGFPTYGKAVYDTLSIARKLLKFPGGEKLPSYRLADACRACAVLFSGAHRSEADTFAAGLLFCELIKRHFGTNDLQDLCGEK